MYILSWLDTSSVKRMATMNKCWWLSARDELFLRSLSLKRKGINRTLKEMLASCGPMFRDLRLIRCSISRASWGRIEFLERLQALTIKRCPSFPTTSAKLSLLMGRWGSSLTRLTSFSWSVTPSASAAWGNDGGVVLSCVTRFLLGLETLHLETYNGCNGAVLNQLTPMQNLRNLFLRSEVWSAPLTPLLKWIVLCPRLTCFHSDLVVTSHELPEFLGHLSRLPDLRELALRLHYNMYESSSSDECALLCASVVFPKVTDLILNATHSHEQDQHDRPKEPYSLAPYIPQMFPKLRCFSNCYPLMALPLLFVSGLESFFGTIDTSGPDLSIYSRSLKSLDLLAATRPPGRLYEEVVDRFANLKDDCFWTCPVSNPDLSTPWLRSLEIDAPSLEGRFVIPPMLGLNSVDLTLPRVEEIFFPPIQNTGSVRLHNARCLKRLQLCGLPQQDVAFQALCSDLAQMPCLEHLAFSPSSLIINHWNWNPTAELKTASVERMCAFFRSLPHVTRLVLGAGDGHRGLTGALCNVIPPKLTHVTFQRSLQPWVRVPATWGSEDFFFLDELLSMAQQTKRIVPVVDLKCLVIDDSPHEARVRLAAILTERTDFLQCEEFDVTDDEEDDFWT